MIATVFLHSGRAVDGDIYQPVCISTLHTKVADLLQMGSVQRYSEDGLLSFCRGD